MKGRSLAVLPALMVIPLASAAADFKLGSWDASASGQVTLGTMTRADERDPTLINKANGDAIGVRALSTGGINGDSGELNFARRDTVSSVLKGFMDLGVKQGMRGAFLRAKAWRDFTLEDEDVPWGNTPNGLVGGMPLADSSFRRRARFSGLALQSLYVYDTFQVADRPLYVRIGEQAIPWGTRVSIGGGLAAIRPFDVAAAQRPGAVSEETEIPVPAVLARMAVNEKSNLEAYYQFRFRAGEVATCGTYFATTDWLAQGCDRVFTGAVAGVAAPTNRDRLAAGAVLKRDPTPDASDSGLFGLGATYRLDALDTLVGAYAARYNNPVFVTRDVVKSNRATGAAFVTGDPDGRNPRYMTRYPEGVKVFALNFESKPQPWTVYGELAYRPNQPVGLNAGDQLSAVTSNTAPTLLRASIAALPPGGVLVGFDRLKTLQAQAGFAREVRDVLGARSLTLGAEIAVKHVLNLPDVNVRRYGRSDIFGAGPVNGVCAGGSIDPAKQCSNDGFVTRNAWGFNLRAALTYADVLPGLTLSPRILLVQDAKGWSYDQIFSEGRTFILASLAGVYRDKYLATVAYANYGGGRYSVVKDRSYWSMTVGAKF
jgi:hypothetical protein